MRGQGPVRVLTVHASAWDTIDACIDTAHTVNYDLQSPAECAASLSADPWF